MRIRTLITTTAVAAMALAITAGPATADHEKGKKVLGLDLTVAAAQAADDGFGVAPEGTSGTGDMYINVGQARFCFFSDITTGEDTEFVAIHLHEKDPDSANPQTGDVEIDLGSLINEDADGTSGCVEADQETLRDVLSSPSDYYINAHFSVDGVEGAPVIRANFDNNGNA